MALAIYTGYNILSLINTILHRFVENILLDL